MHTTTTDKQSAAEAPALAPAACSAPVEYLRRNLVIAKACGAKEEIKITIERLKKAKRVPKWLLASLAAMQVRVEGIPAELSQWRDASPDNPYQPNVKDEPRA